MKPMTHGKQSALVTVLITIILAVRIAWYSSFSFETMTLLLLSLIIVGYLSMDVTRCMNELVAIRELLEKNQEKEEK